MMPRQPRKLWRPSERPLSSADTKLLAERVDRGMSALTRALKISVGANVFLLLLSLALVGYIFLS